MATPVGHSIIGLACGRFYGSTTIGPSWRWYLFAIVAANAADFDFLPGLLIGDVNRYHQFASHSILAALLFGGLVILATWRHASKPVALGVLSSIIYATHLVIDCFTMDIRPPHGIPLLWPVSQEHFIMPVTLFGGVKHGVPGQSITVVIGELFSWHNFKGIALEVVVLTPLLILLWAVAILRSRHVGESIATNQSGFGRHHRKPTKTDSSPRASGHE